MWEIGMNYIQTKRKNGAKCCIIHKQIPPFEAIKHQRYKQIIIVYIAGY